MPGLFDGTPLERPVTCARCGTAVASCACPTAKPVGPDPKTQQVRVRREKRRGKITTVIAGLHPSSDLKGMLKGFKSAFGAGGSVEDGLDGPEIEIQGDHRDKVVESLRSRGYPAKVAGG